MSKFNINDAVFGSGVYYGFNEKSITLPYLSNGCIFSVEINGITVSVAYSISLSNTLGLIKTAILSIPDISSVHINGISPITISILSGVDGQFLSVENLSLICNGSPVYCIDVNEISPLKEKACLSTCAEAPIDFSPLIDAIKEKKDYEPILLCDETTGNPVVVTYSYDDNGYLAFTQQNIDGTPFLGNAVKCDDITYDREIIDICVNGVQWTKVLVFDASLPTGVLATIFIDNNNAVQPAPISYTLGICEVAYEKVINGEVIFLPQSGTVSSTFNGNQVSDVMVTNLTPNTIEIKYTPSFATLGNNLFYCASGQTVHINTKDVTDLISEINITDISSIGDGNVIINAIRI